MHIVFLTWKDILHPAHWWAEVVIHNYVKRLVSRGHKVTWFASRFPGAKSEETLDGIDIIRRYHMHTIWIFASLWYKKFMAKNDIDAILDEAGGWPLLSPLFEKKIPIIFFIHHIWDHEFRGIPLFGSFAKWVYRWMIARYKNTSTITVSESTKEELISDFHFRAEQVTVIKNACDIIPLETIDFTTKDDSILFLGRLMPIKRVEDAIRAFSLFRSSDARFAHYTLDIIGENQNEEYVEMLTNLTLELSLRNSVQFHGFIPKESYREKVARHKIILVPSIKEWFWLVVLEANSYGIPAIGYDVPGLRESIKDTENGFLVEDGNYVEMSKKLAWFCGNVDNYQKISIQSLEYVKNQRDWEGNTDILEQVILDNNNHA